MIDESGEHVVLTMPTLPFNSDEDDVLLHAMMTVFMDYYTAERIATSGPKVEAHYKRLHHWWTVQRQRDHDELAAATKEWHDAFEKAGGLVSLPPTPEHPMLSELKFSSTEESERLFRRVRNLDERNNRKDQAMLHLLVNLRRTLWD